MERLSENSNNLSELCSQVALIANSMSYENKNHDSSSMILADENEQSCAMNQAQAIKIEQLGLSARNLLTCIQSRPLMQNVSYSHLDALKNCYQKNNSYWNIGAKWYGSQTILMKILLVLLFTAMLAGFGAIGQMALIFAIVGFVFAASLGYLLHDHNKQSLQHESQFDAEVVAFESSLHGSVTHLQQLDSSYSKALCAVLHLAIMQADDLSILDAHLQTLQQELSKCSNYVSSLQDLTIGFTNSNVMLQDAAESLTTNLRDVREKFLTPIIYKTTPDNYTLANNVRQMHQKMLLTIEALQQPTRSLKLS